MNHRRYTYLVGEDILLLKRRYTSFLKETHRSFIRSGMGALLLMLLLLTACVGEELQKPLLGEGEGYLTLQIGAISAEVTSDPLTKAMVENLPASTDFAITIKDASGSEVKNYDKLSEIDNPLVLKAGVTYTVEASHGKNEALQDSPYFFGSEEVTIQANTNNQVTVNASLANAMIIPDISNLQDHYNEGWTLTASTNSATKTLTFTNGTCTFYAKAGETVSLNFTGTNKAGETADATWKSISNVEACKAYTVECKPDLAAFYNIQVTATATHTKDASGYLNGTDVVLNNNLNGANENAIETWNVEVKYNGTTIRSYSGSAPNKLTMTQTAGWPYIPQDSELSASVKLKAGDVIDVIGNFASPLPEPPFSVTASAYTSYNKYYDDKDIAAANACDGSKIYAMRAVPTISDELLKNDNYKKNSELKIDNDNVITTDSMTLSWGAHTLKATYTFDNVTVSGSETYHVTGLPYTQDFRTNKDISKWVTSEQSPTYNKDRGYQMLHYYYSTLIKNIEYMKIYSPIFSVPEETRINYTYGVTFYSTVYTKTCTVYSGTVNNTSEYSNTYSDSDISCSTNRNGKYTEKKDKITTINNTQRISFYHNEPRWNDRSSYFLYLTTLTIKYQE